MSSRLQQARTAIRPALLARMLLSGPPGGGKTRTGLIIATELAEGAPILGIDTEEGSMLTYADDFAFDHLPWAKPYDPRELAETLVDVQGDRYGVVLVDSLSHFWRGEGGTLDIANGKFTGWKDARPAQEDLVEAILRCNAHIVLTVRSKVEYAQEQAQNGKHVVRKLGMATVQTDTLEYEVNVAVDLDIDHSATVSKSRTTVLPVGRCWRAGHAHEMAAVYREWLKGGEPPVVREQAEQLVAVLNGIPNAEMRATAKKTFMASYGRPEQVVASNFTEALAFATELAGAPVDPALTPPTSEAATAEAPEGDAEPEPEAPAAVVTGACVHGVNPREDFCVACNGETAPPPRSRNGRRPSRQGALA